MTSPLPPFWKHAQERCAPAEIYSAPRHPGHPRTSTRAPVPSPIKPSPPPRPRVSPLTRTPGLRTPAHHRNDKRGHPHPGHTYCYPRAHTPVYLGAHMPTPRPPHPASGPRHPRALAVAPLHTGPTLTPTCRTPARLGQGTLAPGHSHARGHPDHPPSLPAGLKPPGRLTAHPLLPGDGGGAPSPAASSDPHLSEFGSSFLLLHAAV